MLACVAFFLLLSFAAAWAVLGEDGPVGFGVLAAHGLVFRVFAAANLVKWRVVAIRSARQAMARQMEAREAMVQEKRAKWLPPRWP